MRLKKWTSAYSEETDSMSLARFLMGTSSTGSRAAQQHAPISQKQAALHRRGIQAAASSVCIEVRPRGSHARRSLTPLPGCLTCGPM